MDPGKTFGRDEFSGDVQIESALSPKIEVEAQTESAKSLRLMAENGTRAKPDKNEERGGGSMSPTNHTNDQNTALASNRRKSRLQTLSSYIQNTNKSTTYVIIFTIVFQFRHILFLQL